MAITMQLSVGTVLGTCFSSEQERANAYGAATIVTFPLAATAFNSGSNVPTVDQQALPWYRVNSDGTPDGLYTYLNGSWIKPHVIPASSPVSYFFNANLSSLATYDGGEGAYIEDPTTGVITPTIAISSTTGPMWQVDTTMQGTTALGVSNVAVKIYDANGNQINNWPAGTNGGEIQHTLITPEQGSFGIISQQNGYGGGGNPGVRDVLINGSTTLDTGRTVALSNATNGHNTLPPYRAGFWIQRTARGFYRL